MKIHIHAVGALTNSMPRGEDVIEGRDLTVRGLIEALLSKHGTGLKAELIHQGKVREGLCLLVNGRNVLSLPGGYEMSLKDGDEVLITLVVSGG